MSRSWIDTDDVFLTGVDDTGDPDDPDAPDDPVAPDDPGDTRAQGSVMGRSS